MQITSPGIYFDVPAAAYFADPCPAPSLTQSLAKIIIERSPRHAWHAHPRLNPLHEQDEDEDYNKARAIGNAAHALLLGRGKDLAIINQENFRTKAAQQAKDAAVELGQTPILSHHYDVAAEVAVSARKQLLSHEALDAFIVGKPEVVLAWQEDGLWFRCLVDWLHDGFCLVDDLKTTGGSAAAHMLPIKMAEDGWDIQGAMIERGLNALDPDNIGRRRYRFVALENEPPYGLNVLELGEHDLSIGRDKLEIAARVWRQCMEANEWPGYVPRIIRAEYPGFKEAQWLDRRQGEYSNVLMAG